MYDSTRVHVVFSNWGCSPLLGPPLAPLPLSSFAPALILALSPPAPPVCQRCSRAEAFSVGVPFEVLHITARWSNVEIRGDRGVDRPTTAMMEARAMSRSC